MGTSTMLNFFRPPRFKNSNRPPYNRDARPPAGGASYGRHEALSPVGDSGGVHSSDVGNDEWETASDKSGNSEEIRKVIFSILIAIFETSIEACS